MIKEKKESESLVQVKQGYILLPIILTKKELIDGLKNYPLAEQKAIAAAAAKTTQKKPKEQTFDKTDNYKDNLSAFILAIAKIPFINGKSFLTFTETQELLGKKMRGIPFDTSLFDDQFKNPENKNIFIVEITPIGGREDFDGIFATFEKDNKAFFEDFDYGNYKKYFKENGIKECKRMTWQEAYDKICELAKKEQKVVPNFIEK